MFHGYLPAILEGLRSTLVVAALSLAVACVFGLAGAVAKLSGRILRREIEQEKASFASSDGMDN